MKYLEPKGIGHRLAEACGMLLVTAYAGHLIYAWLRPLIPTVIVLLVLGVIYAVVFGRRR